MTEHEITLTPKEVLQSAAVAFDYVIIAGEALLRESIKNALQDLFEKHSRLQAIRWMQEDSFNDITNNVECFSFAGAPDLLFSDAEPDDFEGEGWVLGYGMGETPDESIGADKDAADEIVAALDELSSENYERAFGAGVEVVATRYGVSVVSFIEDAAK